MYTHVIHIAINGISLFTIQRKIVTFLRVIEQRWSIHSWKNVESVVFAKNHREKSLILQMIESVLENSREYRDHEQKRGALPLSGTQQHI